VKFSSRLKFSNFLTLQKGRSTKFSANRDYLGIQARYWKLFVL